MSKLRPEDERDVLATLVQASRIEAILEVRKRSGCGLKEAHEILRELESRARPRPDDDIVMWEILATGPFCSEIGEFLDCPEYRLASIRHGASVIVSALGCNTRVAWELIAEHLGVVPNDLRTHVIDVAAADLDCLAGLADERELAALSRLRDAGFQFYFFMGE